MRADLHLHSTYSDGHYSPFEICKRAKAAGLDLLSITDHDTLNGESEKRAAAKEFGLFYLTGWEISAYDKENKLHILGYGCDETSPAYLAFTKARTAASIERAKDSVNKMRGAGIDISVEQVLAERSDPTSPVHTMHVARAAGRVLNQSETAVYAECLAPKKFAHSILGRPTPLEAITCIRQSGGFSVLAHPGRIYMPFEEREKTIEQLIGLGLDGIEATYTTHTKRETEYFCALARENGLLITGGSDTHFEQETHKIGHPFFEPDERLYEKILEKIRRT